MAGADTNISVISVVDAQVVRLLRGSIFMLAHPKQRWTQKCSCQALHEHVCYYDGSIYVDVDGYRAPCPERERRARKGKERRAREGKIMIVPHLFMLSIAQKLMPLSAI